MSNITINKECDNSRLAFAARSSIGGRTEQQDSAYISTHSHAIFATVCDGMGGGFDGELASRTAVSSFISSWQLFRSSEMCNIPKYLFTAMLTANESVIKELGNKSGGTTAVTAIITENKLYWMSAGDSRLYIYRDTELLSVTRDHNYSLRLNEMLRNNQITPDTYEQEKKRGEALISYLGKDDFSLYDLTQEPFTLLQGDTILLTTDGLYRSVPEEAMNRILSDKVNLQSKADALLNMVSEYVHLSAQDNTTFILIEVI